MDGRYFVPSAAANTLPVGPARDLPIGQTGRVLTAPSRASATAPLPSVSSLRAGLVKGAADCATSACPRRRK